MFVKFPSIESFHNVVRTYRKYPHLFSRPQLYRGKIKLHGTNAGITKSDKVYYQSRSQLITPENDNAGFARWASTYEDKWANLPEGMTVFGEWCGPGIQKGTAIQGIPRKIFAVFALQLKEQMVTEPSAIYDIMSFYDVLAGWSDTYILPWETDVLTTDWSDDSLSELAANINSMVEACEKEDPWVKRTFDISGCGEGFVFVPPHTTTDGYGNQAFKAKGEQYRVNATARAASVVPEATANIVEFVSRFATEARFQQAVAEIHAEDMSPTKTGEFLKWISQDVYKESEAERENIDWKKAAPILVRRAKEWYVKAI